MLLFISLGFWRFHIWLLNLPLSLYIRRAITLVCGPRAQEAEAEAGGLPVLRCCLQTKSFLIRKCPREVLSAELKWCELLSVVKQCSVKPRTSSHFVFFFNQTQPDKPVSKLLTVTDNTQYTHVMRGYIDNELKVSGQCTYYYYFWQRQDVGDGEWFIFLGWVSLRDFCDLSCHQRGHVDVCGPCSLLEAGPCPWSMLPAAMGREVSSAVLSMTADS